MGPGEFARMEELRARHSGLKITQFFAPYHYTDPELTPERKVEIDTWIKQQRDDFGDELGLHIHGWCHFVTTTAVDCRTKESFYRDDGTGYTTILAAYTEDEMTRILQGAVDMFDAQGLGRPLSFRAGGWTADGKVLRALANTGFHTDSSAVPAQYLSSWKGYDLYSWTMSNWAGVTDTAQPYYPLETAPAQADPSRSLPILEIPDNGVLVDYVTAEDMLRIYASNHPNGGVLERPTLYQVGFHSTNFSTEYFERLDTALDEVDRHRFDHDLGPAKYVTISELEKVFGK
jgi:hypothetical protein